MKKNNKLTIEKILERKKIIDTDFNIKAYYSALLDAEIDVEDNKQEQILDIISEQEESQYKRYIRLIYECCPIFKLANENKIYEVKEPYDIVSLVLENNMNEIIALGNFIMKKYGFLDEDLIDRIKKQ